MTDASRYDVIWDDNALSAAARYMKDDPKGVALVFDAADLLATDPRPPGSIPWGDMRRIHIGLYRLFIEIREEEGEVEVSHLGRTG